MAKFQIVKYKEETEEKILEHMKISVKHRLAGLKNVAFDSVNISLCSSWGLFDSIFAP